MQTRTSKQLSWLSLLLFACSSGAGAESGERGRTTNPLVQHTLAGAQRQSLTGTVESRLRAGPYVYLELRPDGAAPVWVASLAATTTARKRVRALVLGRAERFHSRRLGREFEPLLFAAVRPAADAHADLTTGEPTP